MRILAIIRIENDDLCRPNDVVEALNLVGGPRTIEVDDRRIPDKLTKAVNRVKANDFTWDDVVTVYTGIEERCQEIDDRMANSPVTGDPKISTTHREGIEATINLARRKVRNFIQDLTVMWDCQVDDFIDQLKVAGVEFTEIEGV